MDINEIVKKIEDAYGKHDAGQLAALYAPDATVHHPMSPEPLKSRDQFQQFQQNLLKAFSGVKWKHIDIAGEGNTFTVTYEVSATHTGRLALPEITVRPTKAHVTLQGITSFRLNDQGLIVEEDRQFSRSALMMQLGAVATTVISMSSGTVLGGPHITPLLKMSCRALVKTKVKDKEGVAEVEKRCGYENELDYAPNPQNPLKCQNPDLPTHNLKP